MNYYDFERPLKVRIPLRKFLWKFHGLVECGEWRIRLDSQPRDEGKFVHIRHSATRIWKNQEFFNLNIFNFGTF